MYEQIEKSKNTKSRAISNSIAQRKTKRKHSVGFVNNRPETIMQKMIHSNFQSKELVQQKTVSGEPRGLSRLNKQYNIRNNFHPIQKFSLTRINDVYYAREMAGIRHSDGNWSASGMGHNYAYDTNDKDIWAKSQGNRHAEPGVIMAYGDGEKHSFITERSPCSLCTQDIRSAEQQRGVEYEVGFFVDHKEGDEGESLFDYYELHEMKPPGNKFGN